jgi:hypothetical protein
LAPVVGLAYARAPHKAAGLVAAWNVLGLLDLTDALGLGFLTAPSRYALEGQPTSDLMTVLPLVLIPVYLCPSFLCCISPRSLSYAARPVQLQAMADLPTLEHKLPREARGQAYH